MSKTATTWELMKSSWRVLMRDKVLLAFPVVSGIACFLVLLTFILPAIGLSGSGIGGLEQGAGGIVGWIVLFAFYLCNFFVVFYFNAALVDFVTTRLRGGEPTVATSLRTATACLPQIAMWALVSATVGVLLKAFESRAGWLGRIVIALVGVGWTLVTYFVVPLIVIERRGALEAIGESKDLLAKTWGKQIVSGLGFGLIGLLLVIPALVVIGIAIAGVAVTGGQMLGTMGTLAVLAVLYLVALGIVLSTLRAIFGAVLYLFAQTGDAPEGFSAAELKGAIQPA